MHGLIFVTWEKYLNERFGPDLLYTYRGKLGESPAATPLANRVYDDAALLAGLSAASDLTQTPPDALLYEYGRYFILNGLTSRLCAYLLNGVQNARELLLAMRDAHNQMAHASPEGVSPPLFEYAPVSGDPSGLILRYDSPRHLCSLLHGSIEGAAMRYGEQATINETTCMKRGAPACTFVVRFSPGTSPSRATQEFEADPARWQAQRHLADLVYLLLPDQDGLTLAEIQARLRQRGALTEQTRPFLVLEALNHLHHAGWAANTANEPGDDLARRRYWRLPRLSSV